MMTLNVRALAEAAGGLFCVCVAVAALELVAGEHSAARAFRALCALGATLCALRMLVALL